MYRLTYRLTYAKSIKKRCVCVQVIEFGELDKATVRFLRQLLTKLLKEMEPEELVSVFGR